jgi:hypothetical protein
MSWRKHKRTGKGKINKKKYPNKSVYIVPCLFLHAELTLHPEKSHRELQTA